MLDNYSDFRWTRWVEFHLLLIIDFHSMITSIRICPSTNFRENQSNSTVKRQIHNMTNTIQVLAKQQ